MDEAVFELNFGETESEWMESKEEHSSGNTKGRRDIIDAHPL